MTENEPNATNIKSGQGREFFGGPSLWTIVGFVLLITVAVAVPEAFGIHTAPWVIGIAIGFVAASVLWRYRLAKVADR